MRVPHYIAPLKAGSGRTMLSASAANELVAVCNALLRAQGTNGIKVMIADGGVVIGINDDLLEAIEDKLDEPPGGGSGSFAFRGEWNSGTAYYEGDVVIRSTQGNMGDAKSATFLALKDGTNHEPPAGEDMTDAGGYWTTLARGHWASLVVQDPADSGKATTISKNDVEVAGSGWALKLTNGSQIIDLTASALASAKGGAVTLGFQKIVVCDGGTEKEMIVIGSAPY